MGEQQQTGSLRTTRATAERLILKAARLRRLLVAAAPCQNCGAPRGQECYPDYGCQDWDRKQP